MFNKRIIDEIERLGIVPKNSESDMGSIRGPVTSVYETESSVIATFELPGVEKDEIGINAVDDKLEIRVEKRQDKEIKERESYSNEKRIFKFLRSFTIPPSLAAEGTEATYRNGLLRVEIPKAKKEQSIKKIEIKE